MKLKLLNALYNGRFCLVNADMVKGTSLEGLCVVADEPEQMIAEIKRLMEEDFTEDDIYCPMFQIGTYRDMAKTDDISISAWPMS